MKDDSPQRARTFFRELLQSRYEPLYAPNGTGPYRIRYRLPKQKRHAGRDVSHARHRNATSTGSAADNGELELNSPEVLHTSKRAHARCDRPDHGCNVQGKQYEEYVRNVRTAPPLLVETNPKNMYGPPRSSHPASVHGQRHTRQAQRGQRHAGRGDAGLDVRAVQGRLRACVP